MQSWLVPLAVRRESLEVQTEQSKYQAWRHGDESAFCDTGALAVSAQQSSKPDGGTTNPTCWIDDWKDVKSPSEEFPLSVDQVDGVRGKRLSPSPPWDPGNDYLHSPALHKQLASLMAANSKLFALDSLPQYTLTPGNGTPLTVCSNCGSAIHTLCGGRAMSGHSICRDCEFYSFRPTHNEESTIDRQRWKPKSAGSSVSGETIFDAPGPSRLTTPDRARKPQWYQTAWLDKQRPGRRGNEPTSMSSAHPLSTTKSKLGHRGALVKYADRIWRYLATDRCDGDEDRKNANAGVLERRRLNSRQEDEHNSGPLEATMQFATAAAKCAHAHPIGREQAQNQINKGMGRYSAPMVRKAMTPQRPSDETSRNRRVDTDSSAEAHDNSTASMAGRGHQSCATPVLCNAEPSQSAKITTPSTRKSPEDRFNTTVACPGFNDSNQALRQNMEQPKLPQSLGDMAGAGDFLVHGEVASADLCAHKPKNDCDGNSTANFPALASFSKHTIGPRTHFEAEDGEASSEDRKVSLRLAQLTETLISKQFIPLELKTRSNHGDDSLRGKAGGETGVSGEPIHQYDSDEDCRPCFDQEAPSSFEGSPAASETSYMESSGEESFIVGDDCQPFLDEKDWRQVEDLAPILGLEIALDFLSVLRGTITCASPSTQVSSNAFSADGCSAAAAGSSTTPTSVTKLENRRSNDDDGEDGRKRKRSRAENFGPVGLDPDGLLACPFAKHNPARYSEANHNLSEKAYRRCRTVCLTSIARLKQHLYRVHRQPEYYCSSCYLEFATENECTEHSRSRICPLRDCPFDEKMNSDQHKAIRRKRMGEAPIDAWFGIYEILFPEADRPDNPYVECASTPGTLQSVQDYSAFLESRLPLRLSERLGGPLFDADPMMFQWLINMALEETLPMVLRELSGEYEGSSPAVNDNTDPVGEDALIPLA